MDEETSGVRGSGGRISFIVYTFLGKETQTPLLGRNGQGREDGRNGRGREKGKNYIEIDIKRLCFWGVM